MSSDSDTSGVRFTREQLLAKIELEHGPAIRALVEKEMSADAAAAAADLKSQRQHDRKRVFNAPAGAALSLGGGTWAYRKRPAAISAPCSSTQGWFQHHRYDDDRVCIRCGYERRST